MNRWTNRLVAVAAVTLLASLAVAPAHAATGNQGWAVYRDGVLVNTQWHAAIMDKAHWDTPTYPVIHTPGNGYVRMATWSSFLDGNTYQGTYRPKGTAPTSAQRDLFVNRARLLKDAQILYDPWYQVQYDTSDSGKWVDVAEISKMRCDGVIEYIYEWDGFRVYGTSDTNWDVTLAGTLTRNRHSGGNIGPKGQAQSYLTKVTSSLP